MLNSLIAILFFSAIVLLAAGDWRWLEGWIFSLPGHKKKTQQQSARAKLMSERLVKLEPESPGVAFIEDTLKSRFDISLK